MAKEIRINPEELTAIATQLDKNSEEFNELVKKMQKLIEIDIPNAWAGAAKEKYDAQFSDLKPGFDHTTELISDISTQLKNAVKAVQELDENIAKQLGVQ